MASTRRYRSSRRPSWDWPEGLLSPEEMARLIRESRGEAVGVDLEAWVKLTGTAGIVVPDPTARLAWAATPTDDGPGLFLGRTTTPGDVQSDGGEFSTRLERQARTYCLLGPAERAPGTEGGSDEVDPPDVVLARLRDATSDPGGTSHAVIDAEVTPFTGEQLDELLPLLRQFIDRHRGATDEPMTVAVAAAVRKYVAELPAGRLDEVAALLDGPPSEAIELEVTKMVARKLTAVPPARADEYPMLAARARELVEAYGHPRHLRRPELGAIMLNGALAAALLQGGVADAAKDRLKTLPVGWFRQQLAYRAERAAKELKAKYADGRAAAAGDSLLSLAEACRE